MFRDFSNLPLDESRDLDGVTPKLVVKDGDTSYILKFAKAKENYIIRDYLTEYLACSISKCLGYKTQEVELGHYLDKECVAIKMFDYNITTFEGFGESTRSGKELVYDLDNLIHFPFKVNKFTCDESHYILYVWCVFVLDMYLCNFDRHENNWGFIKQDNGIYTIAGLYDMGASLFPKLIDNCTALSDTEIRHMLEFNTRCAILYKGKKKTYSELISIYKDNNELKSALTWLFECVNKSDYTQYLDTICEFNPRYETYVRFITKVLQLQKNRLEEL